MPADLVQLLQNYPPDEGGWSVEKYQTLKMKLGHSNTKFNVREIKLPNGTTRKVIQKGPPSGGATPLERDFVENFERWVVAVDMYNHQEKLALEELQKEEEKIRKEKGDQAKKETAIASKEEAGKKDASAKPPEKGPQEQPSTQLVIPEDTKAIEAQMEKCVKEIYYGKTPEAKVQAIQTLQSFGEKASGACQCLIFALKDASPEVRKAAIYALGKIGKPEKDILEAFLNTLELGDVMMRRETSAALALLDNAVVLPAFDKLALALGDEDAIVRYRIVRLFEKLGEKKAKDVVEKRIWDPDLAVQVATASALVAFLPVQSRVAYAKQLEDVLIKGVQHTDPPVRLLAAQKIVELSFPSTMPKLEQILSKVDPEIKAILEPLVNKWKQEQQQKQQRKKPFTPKKR
jgi:hypothetical protein